MSIFSTSLAVLADDQPLKTITFSFNYKEICFVFVCPDYVVLGDVTGNLYPQTKMFQNHKRIDDCLFSSARPRSAIVVYVCV